MIGLNSMCDVKIHTDGVPGFKNNKLEWLWNYNRRLKTDMTFLSSKQI